MFITRPRNALYFKTRGSFDFEYFEPFTYADGGVTAVTGGNWTDVGGGGWLIQSNKLAVPSSIASGAAYSKDFTTWNRQKAYQIEVLGIQASDFGGQTRLMMETDNTGSNQNTVWIDIQYLTVNNVQLTLGSSLTTLATVSGLVPGGASVPWKLMVDVGPAFAPATTRRHRVYFNGAQVIDDTTAAKGIGSTAASLRRLSFWSTWGPTQLWKFDSIRFNGNV